MVREQGVPGEENGADRWSLDHLFVDDEGVPTLVEVKRSTDTRIRREVVGQMLDYAANGVSHWPEGSLRGFFENTAGDPKLAQRQLADHLQGGDADDFWTAVEDNLRSGRLRLVFVADHIPDTLRRIIEFLNEQMDRTEVIGVEVQQYLGGEHATLVPRVLGRTTAALRKKAVSSTYEEDLAAVTWPSDKQSSCWTRSLPTADSAPGGHGVRSSSSAATNTCSSTTRCTGLSKSRSTVFAPLAARTSRPSYGSSSKH